MNQPMPTVSIIMPCLNCAGHLTLSVRSVLDQTIANLELLFVDNGSTDTTLAKLEQITDPRLIILHQPEKGVSRARNLAIEKARGEYIAFLDSDDTWEPDFLEKMLSALNANPDAALAYCGWQNLGKPGRRGAPFLPPDYESADKIAHLLAGCRWPIHAALTRSEFIKVAGGFDENFAIGEDFLLWMEIGCFYTIVRVPEIMAYYHHHEGDQATKNKLRSALETLSVQQTFLKRHPAVFRQLGYKKVRDLTFGPLLKLGFDHYWRRELEIARPIFRRVMASAYGRPTEWKYMLPALLPLSWHRAFMNYFDGSSMQN